MTATAQFAQSLASLFQEGILEARPLPCPSYLFLESSLAQGPQVSSQLYVANMAKTKKLLLS